MNRFDKQELTATARLFMDLLMAHRLSMGPANRKKTEHFKNPVWLYPSTVERKYRKQISSWQKILIDEVNETLKNGLDNWIDEYSQDTKTDTIEYNLKEKTSRSDELNNFIYAENNDTSPETEIVDIKRNDTYSTELKKFTDKLYKLSIETFSTETTEARTFISTVGMDTSTWNDKEWQKQATKLIGIKFIVPEPWESEVIAAWSETNFSLIKSLNEEYIKKVNFIVSDGVTSGLNSQEIKKDIKKLSKNISGPRSELIARDQVGKLNGQLTRKRQEVAGVDMYIWFTAGDERVRRTHRNLDKDICKWGNPTVVSSDGKIFRPRSGYQARAEPGQPIRCRCNGSPFFDEMIKIVDDEIRKEKERQFTLGPSGY